jgi:predicted ATP-grasp superfamily ATP-dependent carboligase
LLLKAKMRYICIFAETHSQLPDSKAAAKIIEVLNHFKGLNIDVKPLLESAKKFEEKIKKIIEQATMAQEQVEKKQDKDKLSYLG